MTPIVSFKYKRERIRRNNDEILSLINAYDQVKDHVEPDEFCRSHDISPGTFYNWRRLERRNGKYSGKRNSYGQFFELRSDSIPEPADPIVSTPGTSTALFASIFISGKTVHLHQSVTPDYIRLLLGL